MSTITIELCAEDRARLDAIIAGLGGRGHSCACQHQNETTAPEAVEPKTIAPAPVAPAAPAEVFEPEAPAAAPEAPKTEEKPKPVDFEEFRGRVAKYLAGGGDKAALKAYLEEHYGTGQVSAVPEDKRAEVLAHIEG